MFRTKLAEHHSGYSEAKDLLDDSIDLLENCHESQSLYDDTNRRLCNQAFFKKIYVDNDDEQNVEGARRRSNTIVSLVVLLAPRPKSGPGTSSVSAVPISWIFVAMSANRSHD